jgi:hypothetical protein
LTVIFARRENAWREEDGPAWACLDRPAFLIGADPWQRPRKAAARPPPTLRDGHEVPAPGATEIRAGARTRVLRKMTDQ